MKKLLKRMSPLAPDDSGACSVLYELGGITVICDAGGCAGNVCGFDEPRWFTKKSALFSAGLRDMDAILGRDDLLVKKLKAVCDRSDAPFTAIIGTPVPAVIATDLNALEKMCERKTGRPCIAVDTDGTAYYDKGMEKTYLRLFGRFTENAPAQKSGRIGILGATPLDLGTITADALRAAVSRSAGKEAVTFGMESGIEPIRSAAAFSEILCISPAAVPAARLLQSRFGIPYSVGFPVIPDGIADRAEIAKAKRILIIHQQFAANELRTQLHRENVDTASFFTMLPAYQAEQDFHIRDEDMLIEKSAGYDLIIADSVLQRVLKDYHGAWIDFPHFAVSGRLAKGEYHADT